MKSGEPVGEVHERTGCVFPEGSQSHLEFNVVKLRKFIMSRSLSLQRRNLKSGVEDLGKRNNLPAVRAHSTGEKQIKSKLVTSE